MNITLSLPSDTRFVRPGNELLIDAINRRFGSTFKYTELLFDDPNAITYTDQDACGQPLTKPDTNLVMHPLQSTGLTGATHLAYSRLNLGEYLGADRQYLEGDSTITEQAVLDYMLLAWNVSLSPDDCDVVVGEEPGSDGAVPVTVTPHANHLIWNGPAILYVAAADHIGLELSVHSLAGFSIRDVTEGVFPQSV